MYLRAACLLGLFFQFVDAGTVTFTVYTDDQCTELPPRNSVVTLDDTVSCNETPDSSISDLVCSADKITYTNHPNTADCSASPIANELPVGVCTYFPGPVSTWKLIDASTYTCYSGEGDSEATPSPTADSEATPSSSAGGSFEYAIYLDSECTQLGGIGSDMPPWTFDTEVCNSWAGGVGDNSMKISSCSSTCICFTQTAGNRDCSATPNQNVKEACLDTCVEDAQGTFVSMLSFNGCSEALTVSDAEYSCATTGMASDSPSGQVPTPASSPSPSPPSSTSSPPPSPSPPVDDGADEQENVNPPPPLVDDNGQNVLRAALAIPLALLMGLCALMHA
ncbi:hypothetical protein CYMTET_27652 [Cymbomonas tetramitiformis]|uniref:Uncharacterized protein n=1 Tax=Cymbomonas tetramitiformis TaxID=36881 RepID=A0AAE0FPY5_9CHLO|nr:hypothetical protein CYMTET_27652 [Cymbomonas tetramitiformis]